MKIGFLGLGNMGGPMAHNLLKAGHQLTVFDLSEAAVANLVSAGATAAPSIGELARSDVEMIITMLPAAPHVKSVYLGDDGLLANVASQVRLIDSSTIDPMSARDVAAAAEKQGNRMIDAPVSGGTGGATAGTLTFMVGGDKAVFDASLPVLQASGMNYVTRRPTCHVLLTQGTHHTPL